MVFFFFKQKTAYEIGTGDWSSDVCSSDLGREMTKERWMAGKRERKERKMKEVRVMADDGGTDRKSVV